MKIILQETRKRKTLAPKDSPARRGLPWSSDEVTHLMAMVECRLPWEDIAEALQRGELAVKAQYCTALYEH